MAEPLLHLLGHRVRAGVVAAYGTDAAAAVDEPIVLPTRDPKHGDYQTAAPLQLAKVLRQRPLVLAERLALALDVDDVCLEPEVAPPGFVNLRLRPEWLGAQVAALVGDDRLGQERATQRRCVIVDYPSPNAARRMHVGHLRTTAIGDCLARVHEFRGHDVQGVSHVGDWGTQFGMLVAHIEDAATDVLEPGSAGLADIEVLYREANARFGDDEAFRDRARQRVVDLQSGEDAARAAWQALLELSRRENEAAYALFGMRPVVERGESFYQPLLPAVVADLEVAGLVVVDDGAKCVFVEGFTNKEGEPLPLIVQKADGGYNYATTDLAALRYRIEEQGAGTILYVVGAEQSQHLEMVFAVGRQADWVPDHVVVTHVPFGLILGEGGKRLRTRTGENVLLLDLLHEAVERAGAFLRDRAEERDQPMPEDPADVARVIGVGAVKYADLSQSRTSNVVFSFDKMLSLKGNTAPYLQYAYARIRSILREAGWADVTPAGVAVTLDEPQEVELAKRLVELGDVLERVVADNAPNHLCAHLYDLSQVFNAYYEHCPVLRSEEAVRTSRLALCSATAATLRLGLDLLGIEVLERI